MHAAACGLEVDSKQFISVQAVNESFNFESHILKKPEFDRNQAGPGRKTGPA